MNSNMLTASPKDDVSSLPALRMMYCCWVATGQRGCGCRLQVLQCTAVQGGRGGPLRTWLAF